MTTMQHFLTILAVIAGTMATRFLPFLIFRSDKKTPEFITHLGKLLPAAALGLLVVYCFKDISGINAKNICTFTASLVTVILHLTAKKMVISIAGGTICYMALLHFFC